MSEVKRLPPKLGRASGPVVIVDPPSSYGSRNLVILTRAVRMGAMDDRVIKFSMTKDEVPRAIKRLAYLVGMKVTLSPIDEE